MKLVVQLMSAQATATAGAVNACWESSERQYRRMLAKHHIISERIIELATAHVLYSPQAYLEALTVHESQVETWLADNYDGDWREPLSTRIRRWN
jgi:hypothetical protein